MKAVSAETNLYDLTANELQSDITIKDNEISGILNYVSDYVGFNSSNKEEQNGNFLALSLSADEGITITTELVGGTKGPVTINDGFCVYRITDNKKQKVKVTFSKEEETETKIYGLTGLECKTGAVG